MLGVLVSFIAILFSVFPLLLLLGSPSAAVLRAGPPVGLGPSEMSPLWQGAPPAQSPHHSSHVPSCLLHSISSPVSTRVSLCPWRLLLAFSNMSKPGQHVLFQRTDVLAGFTCFSGSHPCPLSAPAIPPAPATKTLPFMPNPQSPSAERAACLIYFRITILTGKVSES